MSGVPQEIPDKREGINGPRPSLDIHEAAELIGCCTKTVVKLCDDGELPFHLVRNRRKFRPEDIEEFWRRKRIDRSGPTGIDSSNTKDERRNFLSQGSGADQVTLKEIRSLCRR
jgi:excisionase family DNA binding protein